MKDALFDNIKRLLWKHWDPIGIGPLEDAVGPEDEYDEYARGLAAIVRNAGSLSTITQFIARAEDDIGVSSSPDRVEKTAQLIGRLTSNREDSIPN